MLDAIGCRKKMFTHYTFTSSRLDFGNSLLYNLPQIKLAKLQRLHNVAARIVTLIGKYITQFTPLFKLLHCAAHYKI